MCIYIYWYTTGLVLIEHHRKLHIFKEGRRVDDGINNKL